MEFLLDKSMAELGVTDVVLGIARNLDPETELPQTFEQKLEEKEQWALNVNLEDVELNPTIEGYQEMIAQVGRSVKKNSPTALALIKNIKRRGSLPRINSIVDIYNVESLTSLLAIGAHDFDKVAFPLTVTLCGKEDTFYPISSNAKHVAETDFVYRDQKGIMAWLDVRDSEHYKLDETSKNALFVIQGNAQTSVDMRLAALERIGADLKAAMPELEFERQVFHVGA
ncbi:B3/B4 domain-containing protein [Streptococcus oricebi]|uniref:B3/B4 tRNA-binding domain-containing protein n=1 Tax=Streptococcus oricebi TaxID=1547447 RepID=A0ABS5B3J9_9STRE|nr:phenylalanine--tRNA ligase beta subunit-related protein [Streptococcus oricebi]MBP2623043.1 hypothetical protein [Streptococcus oricebi]